MIRLLDLRSKTPLTNAGTSSSFEPLRVLGVPIEAWQLDQLPFRTSGISLGELKEAFQKLGIKADLKFSSNLPSDTLLSVCKLNDPDHFVLTRQSDGQSQIQVLSELDRPISVSRKEFSKRFSGYYLELRCQPNLDVLFEKSDEGLPLFDSLFQDAGHLKYIDYQDAPIPFVFKFKNIGSKPIKVRRIITSCDCVQSEIPPEPILPQEEGIIRVGYSSKLSHIGGGFNQIFFAEFDSKIVPMARLEISGSLSGRITCVPGRLSIRRNETKVPHYLFVSFPPDYDSRDLRPGLIDRAGSPVTGITVSPSSVREYNEDFSSRGYAHIPIEDRPGMIVYRLDVQGQWMSEKLEIFTLKVADQGGELGAAISRISIYPY